MQSAKSNKLTSTSLSAPKPATNQSSDSPEDHSQLKDPPECGMLVPVEPDLDPSVVIPPSTETEQKKTEPTIACAAQLASAISSKDPIAKKRCQGKQLPLHSAKSNEVSSTSFSYPKPASNQTKNDSVFEDENEIGIGLR